MCSYWEQQGEKILGTNTIPASSLVPRLITLLSGMDSDVCWSLRVSSRGFCCNLWYLTTAYSTDHILSLFWPGLKIKKMRIWCCWPECEQVWCPASGLGNAPQTPQMCIWWGNRHVWSWWSPSCRSIAADGYTAPCQITKEDMNRETIYTWSQLQNVQNRQNK